ncbi:MAG TPA: hypothetical protein VMU92_13215 [Acidobacteriaceae bacterium]|nr:hypothetical protein [Acidobacteriaceae bacterium]
MTVLTQIPMSPAVFNFRSRSLIRGTGLVLCSLGASFPLSGFPQVHPAWPMIFVAFAALWGAFDTLRCLRMRWSFYHGGVLLLLYMDVIALTLIFFLWLYPYANWIQ